VHQVLPRSPATGEAAGITETELGLGHVTVPGDKVDPGVDKPELGLPDRAKNETRLGAWRVLQRKRDDWQEPTFR
jgi:hypothetical protein